MGGDEKFPLGRGEKKPYLLCGTRSPLPSVPLIFLYSQVLNWIRSDSKYLLKDPYKI